QGIYSVAIVALEIPSGYIADVFGRKKTLLIGSLLGFLGYLVYSFSFGFTGFLFAEIILGFGQSLISGADSALLYDSLLYQKREKDYLKLEGRVTSLGNFAEALAGIAGGFLATYSLRMPYYFQAGVAFMAIPAAFTLVEPAIHNQMKEVRFRHILQITRYALYDHKELRFNILYSSIIGTSTLTMAWFVQPYFKQVDVPIYWYGILWTALNLSAGITSLYAYRMEKWMGRVTTIWLITLFISGGYLMVAQSRSIWGIAYLFTFYLVRGFATPTLKDYINQLTPSEFRATVLSIRNFIIRLLFALIGPFLGYVNDAYSLTTALVLAGILFLITGLVSMVYYLRVLRSK
ncbi:MAG: MFS transporter, partial [Salinivirgaceae bacterium]|nr:MFS transporter [Salinivirgaceae bacterium]